MRPRDFGRKLHMRAFESHDVFIPCFTHARAAARAATRPGNYAHIELGTRTRDQFVTYEKDQLSRLLIARRIPYHDTIARVDFGWL